MRYKVDWEAFVQEAREPHPKVFVTIAGYGSIETLHSAKAVYQWTNGRIAFERVYHLHHGTIDEWTTRIVEETCRLGSKLPIVALNEPIDVERCPCCNNSYSRVVDRGYGLKLAAPNWHRDSAACIYINPYQPSLALLFSLEGREIFAGHLHLCQRRHLHFACDEYEERSSIKTFPSVRAQVTRIVTMLLKDWQPATVLIGTGNHDSPCLIPDLVLPRCWEIRKH